MSFKHPPKAFRAPKEVKELDYKMVMNILNYLDSGQVIALYLLALYANPSIIINLT